jgi:hypothetical protein
LLSLSLISDDDALPRGDHGREALNAYQSLTFTQKVPVLHIIAVGFGAGAWTVGQASYREAARGFGRKCAIL